MFRVIFMTHLFVIETGGEGKDPGCWVERENIVCPVGNEGVSYLAVWSIGIGVGSGNLSEASATWGVLRHVERICRRPEARSVVIGIGHLKKMQEKIRSKLN